MLARQRKKELRNEASRCYRLIRRQTFRWVTGKIKTYIPRAGAAAAVGICEQPAAPALMASEGFPDVVTKTETKPAKAQNRGNRS